MSKFTFKDLTETEQEETHSTAVAEFVQLIQSKKIGSFEKCDLKSLKNGAETNKDISEQEKTIDEKKIEFERGYKQGMEDMKKTMEENHEENMEKLKKEIESSTEEAVKKLSTQLKELTDKMQESQKETQEEFAKTTVSISKKIVNTIPENLIVKELVCFIKEESKNIEKPLEIKVHPSLSDKIKDLLEHNEGVVISEYADATSTSDCLIISQNITVSKITDKIFENIAAIVKNAISEDSDTPTD